jgi:hypothetical protein
MTDKLSEGQWVATGSMLTLVATVLLPSIRNAICDIIDHLKKRGENDDEKHDTK